jgi:thiol-disulfide isomerase/thioredoxin
MKRGLTFLLALLAAVTAWADIHADLAAVRTLLAERSERAKSGTRFTATESSLWASDFANRVCTAALRAYEANPAEPARWEAALVALQTPRSFVVEIKPGYDEAIAARDQARVQALLVRDDAARAAWDAQMDALQAALLAATDVPVATLAEAYTNAIYRASLRRGATPAQRWQQMAPLLADMERRVTDPAQLTHALELAYRTLQAADPEGALAFLQVRSQSAVPEVSRWAAGKANVQAAKTSAVDMKFTALDGRPVDLAALRGKVVLIDFWATWCGPCKEELPNVLAAYRKYHAQGFEVVAVSLDAEKDRQKLLDYCREHELPWPQHFDGKGWKNEFAVRYAVRAIPAMFLLDQEGKVVSTDARGPKLEAEIRRLLKLEEPAPAAAPERPMLGAGALAPDFVTHDLAGREVRLSEYRGKVLILDFWATWCGPCIASMPHTQEVAAKYADQGVAVLAVCTGDKRMRFEDWVKLKARDYPALRFTFDPHEQGTPAEKDRASVALYGVPAIPTQFIIDREGRIAGTTTGYVRGDPALERALAAAGIKVDPAVIATAPRATAAGTRVVMNSSPDAPAGPVVRRPAPPFTDSLAKLKGGDVLVDVEFRAADGAPRKLSDFRGKPLVLLFASAEMIPEEYLNGVVTKYGAERIQVLAIVTRDTEANFQSWLAMHGARANRFTTAFDPVPVSDARNGVINRLFQFGAPTPLSMVVDAEGRFVGLFPWKLPQGQEGLAELLRRCGVTAQPAAATTP